MSNRRAQFLLLIIIWLSPALSVSGIEGKNNHSHHIQTRDPAIMNGVSIPSGYPRVKITINDNPETGYIFLNTSWGSHPNYNMILDNTGAPVWYHRAQDSQEIRQDLKVQPDGRITQMIDRGNRDRLFIAMDSTYTVVDTFKAPYGFKTNEHDLKILPNGHYLIIAEKDTLMDLGGLIPGQIMGVVQGNYLIEMDVNDNPVFIWNCFDHFTLQDVVDKELLTGSPIDFAHMNSVDVDLDGHFLISSRNLSEITKINRQTGEIIWRLGGKNDDFRWVNDARHISCQHDIRVLPNGNYTVFDNGNYHDPPLSRALELSVNTNNWTVTKVWEFRNKPDHYSWLMGNVQRLPNGNTLVNWADYYLPKLTEVRPDKSKAFEMDFLGKHWSYRTFRFPWSGKAAVPYLLIQPYADYITLLFNKFGDSDVSEYRIYGGMFPHPTTQIATATEPFVHLSTELYNNAINYFRVTAVNSKNQESDFSNEEMVYVNFTPPEGNLVKNGDFSKGIDHWMWSSDPYSATWSIDNGIFHFNINRSDENSNSISLMQFGIQLVYGESYIFEFDAWAEADRTIEAKVAQGQEPYINYGQIGYSYVTTEIQHFVYTFDMEHITDSNAKIEINAGQSNSDVYIDNIYLREIVKESVDDKKSNISSEYRLSSNYPNPFNPSTTINYQLPVTSEVELSIYNLLGQKIITLVSEKQAAGAYTIEWHAKDVPSGIYLYRLKARDPSSSSGQGFTETRKMVLQK